MIQEFDLHIHSTNSDGEFSVREIVKRVRSKNIKIFSITDHDNVNSINQIKELDLEGLIYIPGIEITSLLNDKYELHILGYNINPDNEKLLDMLEYLKEYRINKFYEILKILKRRFKMTFKEEDIVSVLRRTKNPGKPHIARLMIKYGFVCSIKEAFDNYLSKIKTNVHNEMSLKEVCKIIKEAGGIPILAHPKGVELMYRIDIGEIIEDIKKSGVLGIEVFNSIHSYNDCKKYKFLAEKYNFITSGGSDYHGPNIKNNVKLGVIFNSKKSIFVSKDSISLLKRIKISNNIDVK